MTEPEGLAPYKLTPAKPRKPAALDLVGQYFKVLSKPTASTFALVSERANWRTVWLQVFILALIPLVFGLIRLFDPFLASQVAVRSRLLYDILVSFSFGASIAALILRMVIAPLFFFITVSLQFLLAKMFGGAGTYIEQSHAALLYLVPLTFLSSLLTTIIVFVRSLDLHIFNPLISFVLLVYGIFLNVVMIKGVHRLTGEKSTLVVALYYMVLFFVVIGLLILLASSIISAIHTIGR
jgi:hypothetical protein